MKEEIRCMLSRFPSREEIEEDLIHQGIFVRKNGVLEITPKGLKENRDSVRDTKCLDIAYETLKEEKSFSIDVKPLRINHNFDRHYLPLIKNKEEKTNE